MTEDAALIDPLMHGLRSKGLKKGSVSLVGTVFTWGSKAIGPHIGWMGGFALMLSSILAGVGAAGILTNAVAVWLGSGPPTYDVGVADSGSLISFSD